MTFCTINNYKSKKYDINLIQFLNLGFVDFIFIQLIFLKNTDSIIATFKYIYIANINKKLVFK